jgi:hypothetical protein
VLRERREERQRDLERRGPTPQSKKETSKLTWEKAWIKRGRRSVMRGAWGTWSPREGEVRVEGGPRFKLNET